MKIPDTQSPPPPDTNSAPPMYPQPKPGESITVTYIEKQRFFIEHDMIHDRKTGKHVTTENRMLECNGQTLEGTLALLNGLGEIEAAARACLGQFSLDSGNFETYKRLCEALGEPVR